MSNNQYEYVPGLYNKRSQEAVRLASKYVDVLYYQYNRVISEESAQLLFDKLADLLMTFPEDNLRRMLAEAYIDTSDVTYAISGYDSDY